MDSLVAGAGIWADRGGNHTIEKGQGVEVPLPGDEGLEQEVASRERRDKVRDFSLNHRGEMKAVVGQVKRGCRRIGGSGCETQGMRRRGTERGGRGRNGSGASAPHLHFTRHRLRRPSLFRFRGDQLQGRRRIFSERTEGGNRELLGFFRESDGRASPRYPNRRVCSRAGGSSFKRNKEAQEEKAVGAEFCGKQIKRSFFLLHKYLNWYFFDS